MGLAIGAEAAVIAGLVVKGLDVTVLAVEIGVETEAPTARGVVVEAKVLAVRAVRERGRSEVMWVLLMVLIRLASPNSDTEPTHTDKIGFHPSNDHELVRALLCAAHEVD